MSVVDRQLKMEAGEELDLCFEFLREVSQQVCNGCFSGKKRAVTCKCLSILADNVLRQEAIAQFMVGFVKKLPRRGVLLSWSG